MIEEKELVPVIDGFLEFMGLALAEQAAASTKIAELNQQVASTERLVLEKVAAAKAGFFPQQNVDQTLDRLVALRVISMNDRAKVANALQQDPANSLKLLEKISESLVSSMEGSGIPKTSADSEADPDGWNDFAKGKEVRLKK